MWPSEAIISSPDPLVIRLASGAEVAVGEQVQGGGGYVQSDTLEVDIPEDCLPPTREVAVFNAAGDLTRN